MLVGPNSKSVCPFSQIRGVVQDGFARSDVVWLRNIAQAGT
jgi:hypothetical protein